MYIGMLLLRYAPESRSPNTHTHTYRVGRVGHTKRVTDRYEASPTRDSREIVAIPNRDSLSTSFALGSSFRSLARSASVTRPSRRARRPAAVQLPSRVLPVISRPRDTKSIYR